MSGLLSGLVQSIINRYLQKWLKNVTTEHATIWGGARRSERAAGRGAYPEGACPLAASSPSCF